MLSLSSNHTYLLYPSPCDMRKSFDGLSGLVTNELDRNPLNGDVFIFLNRRGNQVKLLHWENGGFVIYYKRLEQGSFLRPDQEGEELQLSWSDLVLMIEGIKVKKQVISPRYKLPKKVV